MTPWGGLVEVEGHRYRRFARFLHEDIDGKVRCWSCSKRDAEEHRRLCEAVSKTVKRKQVQRHSLFDQPASEEDAEDDEPYS